MKSKLESLAGLVGLKISDVEVLMNNDIVLRFKGGLAVKFGTALDEANETRVEVVQVLKEKVIVEREVERPLPLGIAEESFNNGYAPVFEEPHAQI